MAFRGARTEYVPVSFFARDGRLRLQWLRGAPSEFHDPFFAQTEERLVRRALADVMVETGIDALEERGGPTPCATPAGFVFHASHCGSTLLSNMLAQIPDHLALSEPDAISSLLGQERPHDAASCAAVLRSTLRAFGAWAAVSASRYFIKFFSQTTCDIDVIRQAAPDVPEIFVYRDPLEVLVGSLRRPTQSWIWLRKHTGLPLREAVERPVAELVARGIGGVMQVMAERATDATLLLNYNEIGPDTPRVVLEHLDLPVSEPTVAAMTAVLSYDAKDPRRTSTFRQDSAIKRALATPSTRALAARFANAAFGALEARRTTRRFGSRVQAPEMVV
jgi:hypothetical protein